MKRNSKHSGSCREKAAGESLCQRNAEPLLELWAETVRRAVSKSHRVLPSQRKASDFCSAFRKHTAPEALKQQEACAMSADFIRIQVVPRTDSSALNISCPDQKG